MAVEGDKIFFYQPVAGNDVIIKSDSQQYADFVITVVGKTVAIPYQDEKNIKQKLMMG
jgi:hypothetical protein